MIFMKKKLICIVAAAAVVSALGTAAMADDKAPQVFINNAQIMFADQEPVILGEGHTVVPARGVFEAMGAKVTWDGEKREVEVESKDRNTIINLAIDDNTMRVYDMSNMFASIFTTGGFEAPETLVALDVAPLIMEDTGRTMIPLRAISEALNADVKWDGDAYTINITTADAPASYDGVPAFALSTGSDTVAEGETVDIYIEASNIPDGKFVSGVTATVRYNKENFEFVDAQLMNGDSTFEDAMGVANDKFSDDMVKAVYVTIDAEHAAKTDGKVMKLTFRSINGKEGAFELSNGYRTDIGYNSSLLLDAIDESVDSSGSTEYLGNDFYVSTDPVWVNRADE